MTKFTNPSMQDIRNLLLRVRRIAVVGLSPKASRPSYEVASALQSFGYRIVPVRPALDSILGETAYPDLSKVPGKIDLVDVFRAPEHIKPVVDTCIALQIPALWLQLGVVNEQEALRAQSHGITVVMDRCIYRDHLQLLKN